MNASKEYYKLPAEDIYIDVYEKNQDIFECLIEGIKIIIMPHVYPSNKFRTTSFVLKNLKNLVKDKKVCDMGCGPGIFGLFSLYNGAKEVVQADINQYAVENAKKNNWLNGFGDEKIKTYLSDCFDNIPKTIFDLILFNMPFHNNEILIDDPLKHAFYDPGFTSIKKFLNLAKEYLDINSQVYIAFSNKGNVDLLEKIFSSFGYDWELWKRTNVDQEYDNRLYLLKLKKI